MVDPGQVEKDSILKIVGVEDPPHPNLFEYVNINLYQEYTPLHCQCSFMSHSGLGICSWHHSSESGRSP